MRLTRSLLGRVGSRALALIVACVVCASVVHAGWDAGDDAACDPVPFHHDHSAHRLRTGTLPAGAQDHCLFCHSLRSLGNGLVAVRATVTDTSRAASIRPSAAVRAGRLLDPNAPSRAPPSILL